MRSEDRKAARATLRELKPKLDPVFRQEAVDKILKNPSRMNLVFLVDAESRYQDFTYMTINNLNKRAKNYGIVALCMGFVYFHWLGTLESKVDLCSH